MIHIWSWHPFPYVHQPGSSLEPSNTEYSQSTSWSPSASPPASSQCGLFLTQTLLHTSGAPTSLTSHKRMLLPACCSPKVQTTSSSVLWPASMSIWVIYNLRFVLNALIRTMFQRQRLEKEEKTEHDNTVVRLVYLFAAGALSFNASR